MLALRRPASRAARIGIVAGVVAAGGVRATPLPPGLPAWRAAGVTGGIPAVPVTGDLARERPAADGRTDDSPAFIRAIHALPSPGALRIPPGTFLLRAPLRLRSGVVLRGAGPDRTRLIFDLPAGSRDAAIGVQGGRTGGWRLTASAPVGGTVLTLDRTEGLAAGDEIAVHRANDAAAMYTRPEWNQSWAQDAVGQIVSVVAVHDRTVGVDAGLRESFPRALDSGLVRLEPVSRAGLEDLTIERVDRAEAVMVEFVRARDCWIRNCATERCTRAHVQIRESRRITVRDSFHHGATRHDGGGHGYGVECLRWTSECLILNNAFRDLRHAMMVHVGANGNVFAYNVSCESRDESGYLMPDISVHGHWSFANLFEGNEVHAIALADHWGPSGPGTTVFRNRVCDAYRWSRTPFGITVRDGSHGAVIVANTLLGGGIQVEGDIRELLVERNRIGGRLEPDRSAAAAPASLFLTGPPDFWGTRPWPGIGADADEAGPRVMLPARERHAAGTSPARCPCPRAP